MKLTKTMRLVCLAAVLIVATGSSPALAYTVNGHAECTMAGWAPYGAVVKAFEVDPLPGGSYTVNSPELATATVNASGNFTLTFPWPSGGGFEVGGPDIIFVFTQNINGSAEIIYEENASGTRWNVADATTIPLNVASPLAVCSNPAVTPSSVPNNKLFLFTRIGNHETANIDSKGSVVTSQGYHRPRKVPYSFAGANTDQPYGSALDMFGYFGSQSQIAYYKVQYSADGGATWTDIKTLLPNKWYSTSDPNPLNWNWVSESMGPVSYGGINNLYRVPYFVRPNTPWSWFDRVAIFNSTLVTDGLTRFKIAAYKQSGASLIPATSSDIIIDPNYGEIVLQIDNTPPAVKILDVKLNGVSKNVCQILNFGTGSTDKISVNFRAHDQRGHLQGYALNAMYGHNASVSPKPTTPNKAEDNYNNNAGGSPLWQGGLGYITDYKGDIYTPTMIPDCAYQFRLTASKRTTNGYGLIYHNVEDTWHITIDRP